MFLEGLFCPKINFLSTTWKMQQVLDFSGHHQLTSSFHLQALEDSEMCANLEAACVFKFHFDAPGTIPNVKALLTTKGPKINAFKNVDTSSPYFNIFLIQTELGDLICMDGVGMGPDGYTIQHAVFGHHEKPCATTQLYIGASAAPKMPDSDVIIPPWLQGHLTVKRGFLSSADAAAILSSQIITQQWGSTAQGRLVSLNTINDPSTSIFTAALRVLFPDRKTMSSVTFFYNPKHDGPIVNGTTDKENDSFVGPTASFTNLWAAKGRALRAILTDQVSSFQDMVAFTCSGKDALSCLKSLTDLALVRHLNSTVLSTRVCQRSPTLRAKCVMGRISRGRSRSCCRSGSFTTGRC